MKMMGAAVALCSCGASPSSATFCFNLTVTIFDSKSETEPEGDKIIKVSCFFSSPSLIDKLSVKDGSRSRN